ncbi:unnamed protein product, partial [marine sediment metagenome]
TKLVIPIFKTITFSRALDWNYLTKKLISKKILQK